MIDYTFVSSIRGQGRIRTAEAVRQQIYSLPVLTTYLPTRCFRRLCDSHRIQTCNLLIRSQMLYSVELASQNDVGFNPDCGFLTRLTPLTFRLSVGADGFEPPTLCL